MIVNNKAEKIYTHSNVIRNAIPGVILGAVFIVVGVFLLIVRPVDDSGKPMGIVFPAAAILVGALALVVSVRNILHSVHALRSAPLPEEEVQANVARFDTDRPVAVHLNNTRLVSRPIGRTQQGLAFEDQNGRTVYEIKLNKFRLVGKDDYEFIDGSTGESRIIPIGKTISNSTDDGLGLDLSVTYDSHFSIDGVNCWEYLRQRGYEIRHIVLEANLNSYQLYRNGQQVANIISVDARDPWNSNGRSVLGMMQGSYRIEIADARLEDVAMAAFIAFRVEAIQ